MSTKFVSAIVTALAVIAILVSVRDVTIRRTVEGTLEDAKQDCENFASKLHALQRRANLVEQSVANLEKTVDTAHADNAADVARAAKVAEQARSRRSAMAVAILPLRSLHERVHSQ